MSDNQMIDLTEVCSNKIRFPVVYTVENIQEILGIGKNQAYRLAKSKQFPIKRIGARIVIPIVPFNNWLNDINSLT